METQPGEAMGMLLILFAAYAYISFSVQMIANKTGTDNSWMAWVPILNIWLLCEIGGKPGWWVLLMFVPLVNIVIITMLWGAVSEARGKASWLGILILLPFLNLVLPGYLAFSE